MFANKIYQAKCKHELNNKLPEKWLILTSGIFVWQANLKLKKNNIVWQPLKSSRTVTTHNPLKCPTLLTWYFLRREIFMGLSPYFALFKGCPTIIVLCHYMKSYLAECCQVLKHCTSYPVKFKAGQHSAMYPQQRI